MQGLFRKIRLITPLVLHFSIDKDQFIQRLQPHVAPPHINPFGRLGRIFSPEVAPYTGIINTDTVQMKPRAEENWAFAPSFRATLLPDPAGVRVEGELNGASLHVVAPALLYSAFILFVLTVFVSQTGKMTFLNVIMLLLAFLFQGAFLVGLPYFKTRRGMQKMANDLKRDLFYFVERPVQSPNS
ncbi:hypothetical protein [Hymenobacter metallilatus]|uniref:Uncharacterized protein n=1 Tax=Hymenobacter metallilatus TaxID=2493666 RepID=A0A3R9LP91_9BACT|nr:hypothetical protein [Hymenobacter metallilatus]RSK24016.1 hypothetical protein EI290_21305 [Hymenobacter metallilatus]